MMSENFHTSGSGTDFELENVGASGFSSDCDENAQRQQETAKLYRDDDDFRTLINATKRGQSARVKKLCQNGCNVNGTDKDGKTALIHAAENGHKDIVALLLDYRSDINAVDKNGNSALMYASMLGHRKVVKWLCENDADVDVKAQDGSTALIHASRLGHADIARSLCKHGANTNVRDHKRKSPLSYAASNGRSKVVGILCRHGADVNDQGKTGMTALHLSALLGHEPTVMMLLEAGASTKIKNKEGNTPEMLARCSGHLKIANVLRKRKTPSGGMNFFRRYKIDMSFHSYVQNDVDDGNDDSCNEHDGYENIPSAEPDYENIEELKHYMNIGVSENAENQDNLDHDYDTMENLQAMIAQGLPAATDSCQAIGTDGNLSESPEFYAQGSCGGEETEAQRKTDGRNTPNGTARLPFKFPTSESQTRDNGMGQGYERSSFPDSTLPSSESALSLSSLPSDYDDDENPYMALPSPPPDVDLSSSPSDQEFAEWTRVRIRNESHSQVGYVPIYSLSTAPSPLPTAPSPLPTVPPPLPTARPPLPTARPPLPTARPPLPTARPPLPTARPPLPTAPALFPSTPPPLPLKPPPPVPARKPSPPRRPPPPIPKPRTVLSPKAIRMQTSTQTLHTSQTRPPLAPFVIDRDGITGNTIRGFSNNKESVNLIRGVDNEEETFVKQTCKSIDNEEETLVKQTCKSSDDEEETLVKQTCKSSDNEEQTFVKQTCKSIDNEEETLVKQTCKSSDNEEETLVKQTCKSSDDEEETFVKQTCKSPYQTSVNDNEGEETYLKQRNQPSDSEDKSHLRDIQFPSEPAPPLPPRKHLTQFSENVPPSSSDFPQGCGDIESLDLPEGPPPRLPERRPSHHGSRCSGIVENILTELSFPNLSEIKISNFDSLILPPGSHPRSGRISYQNVYEETPVKREVGDAQHTPEHGASAFPNPEGTDSPPPLPARTYLPHDYDTIVKPIYRSVRKSLSKLSKEQGKGFLTHHSSCQETKSEKGGNIYLSVKIKFCSHHQVECQQLHVEKSQFLATNHSQMHVHKGCRGRQECCHTERASVIAEDDDDDMADDEDDDDSENDGDGIEYDVVDTTDFDM